MPFILQFRSPAADDAVVNHFGSNRAFEAHITQHILEIFTRHCREKMTTRNVIHPLINHSTSIPIGISIVVMAWYSPIRHANEYRLKRDLRNVLFPPHFPVSWQVDLELAGSSVGEYGEVMNSGFAGMRR